METVAGVRVEKNPTELKAEIFPAVQRVIQGLSVPDHNHVTLGNYVGSNPGTVIFRQGGSGGTIVATLTLTYDGNGNLLTVSRS